ncbi:RNA 2',3'-cyclic phosphodiesterase [Neobacillus mesonae]|uniref:RNA 2',3'-cyclic phosphodiesterase n=1 Tax=Neobacillus mesonae TaxID=1193713 RepID=UPI00203D1DC6|nr:RNA 2',3'-cyclic phosphodiesterase [Neobacillus mesonae]MCM3569648.1 RNA 2',3'-cyclic phosphodiesterase [Neobacillus mesonae]
MMQYTHYFFAVKISEETKVVMKGKMEKLQKAFPFKRWVYHQDLHITLAFLGAADSDMLTAAVRFVEDGLKNEKTFSLKIHGLGIFGRKDSPRIFWADTMESAELSSIRKKVFLACEKAGFSLESRPFRPHITLARKWDSVSSFEKNKLEPFLFEPLPFTVNEIVLYQTRLDQLPKYEAINVITLK